MTDTDAKKHTTVWNEDGTGVCAIVAASETDAPIEKKSKVSSEDGRDSDSDGGAATEATDGELIKVQKDIELMCHPLYYPKVFGTTERYKEDILRVLKTLTRCAALTRSADDLTKDRARARKLHEIYRKLLDSQNEFLSDIIVHQ